MDTALRPQFCLDESKGGVGTDLRVRAITPRDVKVICEEKSLLGLSGQLPSAAITHNSFPRQKRL